MSVLDALAVRLADLQARVSRAASFRWGVVSSANPLAVTLDADSTPTVGVSTITQVAVGSRVLVLFWGSRATILGVGGGADANIMVITGTQYQKSGSFQVGPVVMSQAGNVYTANLGAAAPSLPPVPSGWYRAFTIIEGGVNSTWISSAGTGIGNTYITGRGPGDRTVRVGWHLVKM